MGSGPARELVTDSGPPKPLPDELAEKVEAALSKLDSIDPGFKERRADELFTQNVKAWTRTAKAMDAHLRAIAKTLINFHQLSLDIGSDGGGASTKPWLEETSMAFERIYFKLVDGTEVHATFQDEPILKGSVEDALDRAWLEKAVTKWIQLAVQKKS
jgi:hypothetical protein